MELTSASSSVTEHDLVVDVRGLSKRFYLRPEQRPGSWLDALLQSFSGQLRRSGQWVNAVDDVDLSVRRGEILGLLGPNGAGKTTLIKLLCGLTVPSSGGGQVLGFDLLTEHASIRANVSLVAPTADVGADNNLTVRQNLEFWAFVYDVPARERRRRIDDLLEVVDLGSAQDAWPMHISAGMRQRLAIARSLLAHNPLLLLDEPTVKLDPEGAHRIRAFITELRAHFGITMLLTTHYMFEADQLCDRIAFMDAGRIIALDTPANLKRMLASEYTTEVLAENIAPSIEERLLQLPAVSAVSVKMDSAQHGRGTIRLHSSDSEANFAPLLALLRENDIRVLGMTTDEPTLEDVFFQITGDGRR
jgi:ABC-2 type transport system ATP-binding protein